jgi:hypothetical protein
MRQRATNKALKSQHPESRFDGAADEASFIEMPKFRGEII